MNGLISRASRFTLITSACLVTGFALGSSFDLTPHYFQKEEINFSKMGWLSREINEKPIAFATVDYPESAMDYREIKLAEFHLPQTKKRFSFFSQRKNHSRMSNLQKLSALLKPTPKVTPVSEPLLADYRIAHERMRNQFQLAVKMPNVSPIAEAVEIAPSKVAQVPEVSAVLKSVEVSRAQSVKRVVSSAIVSVPVKVKKQPQRIYMNTQKMSTHNEMPVKEAKITEETPVITSRPDYQVQYTVPSNAISVKQNRSSSAPVVVNVEKHEAAKKLSNELENKLLDQHVEKQIAAQQASLPQIPITVANQKDQLAGTHFHPQTIVQDEIQENEDDEGHGFTRESAPSNQCSLLPGLSLVKPIANLSVENSQICPEQNEWISKAFSPKGAVKGWTKVQTAGFLPLLVYYKSNAPLSQALVLDQNSIAVLSLKTGVKVMSGMGMVVGTLPDDYQIEFSGRGEEVEYFEHNSKKYFAIMNVEPGSGVTELVSKKDQSKNATVFTPVLGDTVTFLNLSQPVTTNIAVTVVKENKEQEVGGLTVGISTQTQVQAITQSNGHAVIRNVNVVPGYPVFVDVSSKVKSDNPNPSKAWIQSYQYRYELKNLVGKTNVLRQLPEKDVYHWLRQIKSGLSDQSAMVYFQIRKDKIQGHTKDYFVRVQPKTEKFGLEPKNYTILWTNKLSEQDPLEGDRPRSLAVQVPEGLSQAHVYNEKKEIIHTNLIPVSPRVIHVISE